MPGGLHGCFCPHSGVPANRPNDSFRGWLWTISRNKITDHFRRYQAGVQARGGTDAQRQLAQTPDFLQNSSSATDSSEFDDQLQRRALELLHSEFEDRTWQAFWRMTIDGRPAAEIAEDLGMTKKAVRQAKFRVLQRLRQELDGLAG